MDGAQDFFAYGSLFFRGYLEHLAVVSKQSVQFLFHVARLRIYGCPDALFLQSLQGDGVGIEPFGQSLAVRYGSVFHVVAFPQMPLHFEGDAPVFPAYGHPFVEWIALERRHGITMLVDDVAGLEVHPSACRIDKACVVGFADGLHATARMAVVARSILSPAFVVGYPYDDARMIFQRVDDARALIVEVLPDKLLAADTAVLVEALARHVLPHEHSHLVTVIVPACGFYLDVFAYHVHAQRLYDFYVVAHPFVRRRSEQAVRPPSLVEHTELVQRFVVQ